MVVVINSKATVLDAGLFANVNCPAIEIDTAENKTFDVFKNEICNALFNREPACLKVFMTRIRRVH